MEAPFATACVLSFNRPQFLQTMIGTMIANAGHPLEIIVHDDGSSDPELRKMLDSMVTAGLISTLITNPPGHNQGQGVALNRMFQIAKGDPIIKLDHDLIFGEGWLRHTVDVLARNEEQQLNEPFDIPEIGCLGLFKYHAEPVHHEAMHLKSHPEWDEVQDFVGSAIAIPRRVWTEIGRFEEHSEAFAEDHGFKMRAKDSYGYALGLTKEDYVRNQGFGVGPSTLVINEDHDLQTIHTEPKIIYPRTVNGGPNG